MDRLKARQRELEAHLLEHGPKTYEQVAEVFAGDFRGLLHVLADNDHVPIEIDPEDPTLFRHRGDS